ncbi:MAG: cytochrome c [Betaproteobacteria bacterium]
MKRFAIIAGMLAAVMLSIGAVLALNSTVDHRGVPQPVVVAQADKAAPSGTPVAVPSVDISAPAATPVRDNPGFYAGEADLNASERAGREIWYKATAGNSRFHTYTFQQRVGVLIDWYRVLNSKERDDRMRAWGLVSDPGCCKPGDKNCPAKTLEETYGFDWCPGDDQLLEYVGRDGYRDPACDFADAPADKNDVHNKDKDQRQSSCDLAFGTSTGALGFRKFPNPRFDQKRWLQLNGSQASWEGFRGRMAKDPKNADSIVTHLADGSIEPPFLIGMACGACHIAYDPLHPPKDLSHPEWKNIKGAIGNQYTRISEILVSGMPPGSLEFQVFSHARPGTSDTSAVPTDQVNNPGTINAIINIDRRPTFAGEKIEKWRKVASCEKGAPENRCWCEPGRDSKCWSRELKEEAVHHILKGGEDSIGALEAIQRVYFNIGSCSEQCWVNHLTDLRQVDPDSRNYGQTPFDIGQCRRDCSNFRAVEDRLTNILAFLTSKENDATDLAVARENQRREKNPKAIYAEADLERDLDKQFAPGSVALGREVFAANCARCHSSLPEATAGAFKNRDFRATGTDHPRQLRADWMGNDQSTPVSEVKTFRCRALHSNHMAGHIWAEYGSETMRARAPDAALKEPHDGGRGYYRNISLLSVWAHAPFLHNNAMGPEICGNPANKANDFYRSPYVDADHKTLPAGKAPACWAYDPSVDGRFKLYVASMEDLLNPSKRVPKITRFSEDVPIVLGPRLWNGTEEKQVVGFTLTLQAGSNAGALGDFQHKQFVNDLVNVKLRPATLHKSLAERMGEAQATKVVSELQSLSSEVLKDPTQLVDAIKKRPVLLEVYSSCLADVENDGHPFGEGLSDKEKKALIAFLATL